MSGKTYQVNAERHGGWWRLTSPDVPGAVSQVRKLTQADEHAREAIAFVLDVAAGSFDVHVVPVLSAELATQVAQARAATDAAADAARQAAQRQREVVQALAERAQLSGREIATVLGVSAQRVSQLSPARSFSQSAVTGTGAVRKVVTPKVGIKIK